jgi:photosystem II stability/assembly factor-like uncharacterized protein
LLVVVALSLPMASVAAQTRWLAQNPGTDASFRGMSIVAADTLWISGTGGTFAWTDDGGTNWHPGHVAGAESFDFRAIHAISLDTAVLMVSAQDTGLIYRTTDRGRSWKLSYRDVSKGAFLDAMAFFDSRHGLALGDPVNGRFVILETTDGGEHWTRQPGLSMPPSLPGEGAFAASGTALIACGPEDAWFGTGGAATSRVFHSTDAGRTWSVAETPVAAGNAAAGIFSLACSGTRRLVAVGGNYARPDSAAVTVALSPDGGTTWAASSPAAATSFLSGVAFLNPFHAERLIAVGTEGTALSLDSGRTWRRLDARSLNVVLAARNGSAWAAGAHGSVAALERSDGSKH